MTNDTNTLNGALQELGETMATNLQAKGVTASASDGLTSLANKISDIQTGATIDTSITLTSDESVIDEGESVTLTSVLSASYDDSSQANVDMSGVLIGATVLFKEGSTTLGTGTTNANGVATATINDLTGGTHSIKAVFAGTSVFDDCESTAITIEVMSIPHIEITFTGTTLTQHSSATDPLIGTDVLINYGDGTVETGNNFGHTYASGGTHTIKIYRVTGLGDYCFAGCYGITSITLPSSITSYGTSCFYACTGLTSVTIPSGATSLGQYCFLACTGLTSVTFPSSVTSVGANCFSGCTGLDEVNLNWTTSNAIVTYDSSWIYGADSGLIFYVPSGTKSLYVAKSYPSSKVDDGSVEPGSITLTADKSILSYADGESATLSATVLDSSSQPLEGETVEFFKGSTSLGTSTTNSSGVATKSYSSSGAGDISFTAEVGSLVSGTYTVQDCYKYIASGSKVFSSSTMSFYELFDANGIGDCEISVKLKSANQNGFSLDYRKSNTDTNNTSLERVGTDGANNLFVTALNSGGSGTPSYPSKAYSTNTDLTCVILRSNGTSTLTVGTDSYNYTSIADLRYIGIMNWNNAKTVTYTDFKVKPLTSVSLTSDKSVLSYADSDTATLTATHPLGAGQTVQLYDSSDDSLIGTMTDNNDGTYSYTYNSQGIGDIGFYAKSGNLVSESYIVEDCKRYDNASSDKSSNYSYNNLSSLTFSTDHYEAVRTINSSQTSNAYSPIYIDSDTLPTDFEISIDFNANYNNYVEQPMLTIGSNHPTTNTGATELGLLTSSGRRGLFHRVNGSATWYTESNTLSKDTWYTYYLKVQGTTVTGKILQGSTVVCTSTQTISAVQNYKKWNFIVAVNAQTMKWKNLKIKTL